jgi:hypothetical protein
MRLRLCSGGIADAITPPIQSQKSLYYRCIFTAAAHIMNARQINQVIGSAMAIGGHGTTQQLHREANNHLRI